MIEDFETSNESFIQRNNCLEADIIGLTEMAEILIQSHAELQENNIRLKEVIPKLEENLRKEEIDFKIEEICERKSEVE